MIIYLYGPDSYRRLKKQKEIILAFQNKHSKLTIDRFDLDNDKSGKKWLDFLNFIKDQSLFSEKRLAVASGIGDKKDKAAISLFKNMVTRDDLIILLVEEKKLGKDYAFLNKAPVVSQEFSNLKKTQFVDFLKKEAEERLIKLDKNLLSGLSGIYCPDCWAAVLELDKIALVNNYQAPAVNDYQLTAENFFPYILQLKNKNLKNRLQSLEILLAGDDSAKIFNLLAYQRGVDKSQMADYDVQIKSGKLDYNLALLDFALSVN